MNAVCNKTKIALAVLAMAASASALAAPIPISGYTTSGSTILWNTSDPSITTGLLLKNTGTLDQALAGNASLPGGNVELGKFGNFGPLGTFGQLQGQVNGKSITLSSLQLSDWQSGLDQQYIQAAATSIGGATLTPLEMQIILANFYQPTFATPLPNVKLAPWQLVSDPNISYVEIDGHTVHIGLAGIFNAGAVLSGMFGTPVPANAKVSEVVKVSLDGGPDTYLYTFSATLSGVCAGQPSTPTVCDPGPVPPSTGTDSYTGNYDVTIPEPESLALLGIGLLGLFLGRRRRA